MLFSQLFQMTGHKVWNCEQRKLVLSVNELMELPTVVLGTAHTVTDKVKLLNKNLARPFYQQINFTLV